VVLSGYSGFPPPIKLTAHDITEILLKVRLNTIDQTTTNLSASMFSKYDDKELFKRVNINGNVFQKNKS
jgi:hypothetical protein